MASEIMRMKLFTTLEKVKPNTKHTRLELADGQA
jgi:hypothetical protein